MSKYYAYVDYYRKMVTIRLEDGKSYIFQGEQVSYISSLVSCAKAQRWLKKGCEAWITVVSKEKTNEIDIQKVSTVKEFLDIFLEELLGLPLNREVEFTIDLFSSTEPISIPLYWMAPIELKE